ncbi:MAG: glycosyltransferase [Opitutaceae bacterium]|nr:glycosyltransferase [Opitutaceae bacterium]
MLTKSQKLYYALKPVLPWRLRFALRRFAARSIVANSRTTWPIDPATRFAPEGWPGWPQGKKFSVVLTHDVEGMAGLAKCRQLADLEESLGFRSSFNFIPEGEYRVTPKLREELSARGFEVGVHDLRHDGKLFHSRDHFRANAPGINRYVREWGAVGYRSGFMMRNLDWLHQLDVLYDSSTFDTDPFEPQPDGAGTIFPFWIGQEDGEGENSRSPRGGYVELPYTLPQDSTLFLVLRESSPEVWIRKLDWVAAQGGMVLMNVHPDYIRFDGDPASSRTYPVGFYVQVLEHLRRNYAGQYWHALPREVAAFTAGLPRRPARRKSRRVCMVTHSFYESDNRVTRYAESLAARGDHVDVVALRRAPHLPTHEFIEGVNVVRLQDRFGKNERSKLAFLWPLLRFLAVSTRWITRQSWQQPYDLVHVHNMPDFLVFAAWHPRLTGAKIILDIHDIVPEFYGSKFGNGEGSLTTWALKVVERWSAHFAHHIIVSNHLWLETYRERTGMEGRCSVFINNVDSAVFQPQPRTRTDDKEIVIFPGGLQWHQGLDIALHAFKIVSARLPKAEFHIYGDGNMKPSLVALASELGFNGKVKFFEPVGVRQVARIMAGADLGIVPKRADSFGNEAYSTKIMEFMSVGIPVVISRTKIDQFYFNDSVARFFESGNAAALAEGMIEVLENPELRRRMVANASAYADAHSWKRRQMDYLRIVDELIAGTVEETSLGTDGQDSDSNFPTSATAP